MTPDVSFTGNSWLATALCGCTKQPKTVVTAGRFGHRSDHCHQGAAGAAVELGSRSYQRL